MVLEIFPATNLTALAMFYVTEWFRAEALNVSSHCFIASTFAVPSFGFGGKYSQICMKNKYLLGWEIFSAMKK
jgi:hypothetical protein